MASYNSCTLIGNVGRDAEMRFSPNGQAKTEFSMATTRSWKKDGEWEEATTWHNCVVWGEKGERVAEWARKGMQVLVVGRIENRSWDDEKTGTKKFRSEVIADVCYALGSKADRQDNEAERGAAPQGYAPQSAPASMPGEFVGAPRATPPPRRAQDEDLSDLPF